MADPHEMIVYKNFFIELKIPYSAVRNEQLQIRAIIHNYTRQKQKVNRHSRSGAVGLSDEVTLFPHQVRVEFTETEHICSSASRKGRYLTEVEVDAMSSRNVPYVIIPLELGNHWIEAKAAAYDSFYTDGMRKILKVVVRLKVVIACRHTGGGVAHFTDFFLSLSPV